MAMKKSSSDKMLSQKQIKSNDEYKSKMDGHMVKRSISDKLLLLSPNPKNKHDDNKMKRSISDKLLLLSPSPKNKHDDNKIARGNRFLITINVFGSAGPLRFVVSEDDIAGMVIETALKQYARQGRLPVLGTDIKTFFLYTVDNGFNVQDFVAALKSSEAIGSCGSRNFVLYKQMTESSPHTVDRKGSGWRACFQMS